MLRHEFCRDYCDNYRPKFKDKKNWICKVAETYVTLSPFQNVVVVKTSIPRVVTSKSDVPENCPYNLEQMFETEYRIKK